MLFTTVCINLRTGEKTYGAQHKSAEVAEDKARWSNDLARSCKMFHLVYRALPVEGS